MPEAGRTIAPCRVLEKIGSGGTGEECRAVGAGEIALMKSEGCNVTGTASQTDK